MSRTLTHDFTAVLQLPGNPETLVTLFTSPDGVSRWWGPTTGDAAVGGTLTTSFGHHGVNSQRVREVGPTRVVWESVAAEGRGTQHQQEWLGTRLEFDLAPVDDGTELRFRHVGLTPQLSCWDECLSGWTHFMGSIQAYAETGSGHPYED